MNLIDILTGMNTYTFMILIIFFYLTFMDRFSFKLIGLLRLLIGLGILFFLFVGWGTLKYDNHVLYKGKQITFENNRLLKVCNLKKLYKAKGHDYRMISREFSMRYDCLIMLVTNFSLKHQEDEEFMKMGEVKSIDNRKIFTIVDSLKTGSIGFGASFGPDNIPFVILKNNNHSYVISESNLKYGEIK